MCLHKRSKCDAEMWHELNDVVYFLKLCYNITHGRLYFDYNFKYNNAAFPGSGYVFAATQGGGAE